MHFFFNWVNIPNLKVKAANLNFLSEFQIADIGNYSEVGSKMTDWKVRIGLAQTQLIW